MAFTRYTFSFASGATGSNKQFVRAHSKIQMIVSAMTGYNAGVGNAIIELRAGLSDTDTHVPIQPADGTSFSSVVNTFTAKSVYMMPTMGLPYMSVGFGTAVTGSAANTIDIVVYNEVGSS